MLGDRWERATQEFQAWLSKMTHLVVNYADVQTCIAGELKAWTIVTWTGDMATTWQAGLSPDQIQLHQKTLALAVASRVASMRTFGAVLRGAGLLAHTAVLATTPAGAIVALPAVWKFFNLVRDEMTAH